MKIAIQHGTAVVPFGVSSLEGHVIPYEKELQWTFSYEQNT